MVASAQLPPKIRAKIERRAKLTSQAQSLTAEIKADITAWAAAQARAAREQQKAKEHRGVECEACRRRAAGQKGGPAHTRAAGCELKDVAPRGGGRPAST